MTRLRRPPVTVVVAALTVLLAVWLVSPRFAISGPSLIDDWASQQRAPAALKALAQLRYVGGSPPEADSGARYRPAFTAIWNSLQWHTFDAPAGMVGPNVWNLVRLAGFVAAVAALALVLGMLAAPIGERRASLPAAILAALAPATVLATPALPVDFARFGPQEPLLVAGMVGGALLIGLAVARSLAGRGARSLEVVLPGVLGYALWLLGVYSKEAAVAAVALAPFAWVALELRWRETQPDAPPLWRHPQPRVAAVLMALPVLHVAAVSIRIAARGSTAYGTQPATSPRGLWAAFKGQWEPMSGVLGSPVWKLLATALPIAVLVTWLARRRFPWLAAGLTTAGFALMLYQGLSGVALVSRYYIPALSLFAVAAVVLVAHAPVLLRWALVAAAVAFVTVNAAPARERVAGWSAAEQTDQRLVAAVRSLRPRRCRVYAGGLDVERATALPVVAVLREPPGPCRTPAVLLVQAPPARHVQGFPASGCRGAGWRTVRTAPTFGVFSCSRPAEGLRARLEDSGMRLH